MKHSLSERLASLMEEAGLRTSGRESEMLRHLQWVIATNEKLNLTSITSVDEGLRLHLVDSLTAYEEVKRAQGGLLIDLGTGGGFPGVPLGLASGRPTILMDSVEKKVRALGDFISSEALDSFSVQGVRAEDYARSHPASAAVVVCRAVAPLASLVELAAPLLARGGSFVAMKAPLTEDEYMRGSAAAAVVGLDLVSRRLLSLPSGGERREILHYRLARTSTVPLPRRTGMAQKRPLGS